MADDSRSRNMEKYYQQTRILPKPPNSILAGYFHINVKLYIPSPLRCFKCQKLNMVPETVGVGMSAKYMLVRIILARAAMLSSAQIAKVTTWHPPKIVHTTNGRSRSQN